MVAISRPGVRGRAGACGCGHVGAGVSRRRCRCDHVLVDESCLSRDELVSWKRGRHTLFPSVRHTDPLLVFPAVKKTTPSSREAIGPDERFLVFFVAAWGNGPEAPDACCATNEVTQFIVRCATFVLSVGLFFQRGDGFSQAMSLSTPGEKFEFLIITLKVPNESTSSGARVGIRMGMRGTGCACVWVCG